MNTRAKAVSDSVPKVEGELAVGEDLAFQQRWWRVERITWIVFSLILLLDLGGLFGKGPLADARLRSEDGSLEVRFERIQRLGAPSVMTFSFAPRVIRGGTAQLFVNQKLLGPLGARRVIPQPATSTIGSDGVTYTFPTSATAAPPTVQLELSPVSTGSSPFEVAVPGSAPIHGKIFVVP